MQNIDNDMDDLFRRAAEKYPLHPGQSNWDTIEKKLSSVVPPNDTQKSQRKNNYKKLLLLLILIGISLVIGFMILNLNSKNYQVAQKENQIDQRVNTNNNSISKDNITTNKLSEKIKKASSEISPGKKMMIAQSGISHEKNKIQGIQIITTGSENDFSKTITSQLRADLYPKNDSTIYQDQHSSETSKIVNNRETKSKSIIPANKNENAGNKNILSPKTNKIEPNSKTLKENGLYAGIIGVADFSKVKDSPFKAPGFGAGILLGYKINRSFFIETGIISVTKYYSSGGNNFNEKAASMPDGMVIKNLEGRSKILEIPVKIGYRFYQKKNVNLFLAGGVCTYIMTNEKNNYNVTMNGAYEKMEGIYKKNNVKVPAVFSISAGLEHRLSGLLQIRIEPYLKLPLQGVGVGKLPVTSAGIQIGLIGRLQ
jgi:cell division protein FtsL